MKAETLYQHKKYSYRRQLLVARALAVAFPDPSKRPRVFSHDLVRSLHRFSSLAVGQVVAEDSLDA